MQVLSFRNRRRWKKRRKREGKRGNFGTNVNLMGNGYIDTTLIRTIVPENISGLSRTNTVGLWDSVHYVSGPDGEVCVLTRLHCTLYEVNGRKANIER